MENINLETFMTLVGKLKRVYTEKTYSDERVGSMYQHLKQYNYKTLKYAIDWHINNSKFAPLLGELLERVHFYNAEVARKQREIDTRSMQGWSGFDFIEDNQLSKRMKLIMDAIHGAGSDEEKIYREEYFLKLFVDYYRKIKCKCCYDEGLVFSKNPEGYIFIFKCGCEFGEKRLERVPTLTSGHLELGFKLESPFVVLNSKQTQTLMHSLLN